MTYKHASRDGPIAGGVVGILLQIGAFVNESLAGGTQSLLLEVTLVGVEVREVGTINQLLFIQL